MKTKFVSLSFLIFAVFSGISYGCAAKEFGVPVCAYFTRSSAVFLGKALEIENLSGKEDYPEGRRKVRFKVLQNFKGVENPTFTLLTSNQKADCGLKIKTGQTWIVYAGHDIDGKSFYGFRGVKYNPQEKNEELEILKASAEGKAETSILGQLATASPPGKYSYEPVEITIDGNGTRKNTTTDAEGAFILSPLPAGKYRVKMSFPYRADLVWPELLLKTSFNEGIPTFFEYEVELRQGDCEFNFFEVLKKTKNN
jgi:hypothetical protein